VVDVKNALMKFHCKMKLESRKTNQGRSKMRKLTTAIILMGTLSAPVMAEEPKLGMYGGVQYAMTTFDLLGIAEANPTALVFSIGNKINKNLAIEGRFGIGIGSDTFDGSPIELEVDTLFGVYAKGIAPVGNDVDLYGIVGYSSVDLTVPGLGSESESDLSFGFGIDIATGKTSSVNLEYINYFDNEVSLDALSIGTTFKF